MLSKLTENSYNENDQTFMSNNVPCLNTEQNSLLREQDNNQIYNGACVLDENEQIRAQEHSKTTDNLTTEQSLAKCEHSPTTFPDSLRQMHAQTRSESSNQQTRNDFKETLKICQFCRNLFPDSLFEQHIGTCNRKERHARSTCEKVFRVVSKLRGHEQSHSEELLHPCKICAKPFKFKSGLSRHMKRQHSGIETNELNTSLCDELQGLEYASLRDDEERSFEEENLTTMAFKTSRLEEYGSLLEDLKHPKSRGQMVENKAGNQTYNFVKIHSDKPDLEASSCEKNSFSYEDESLDREDDYFKNVFSQNDRCLFKDTTCTIGEELNLNRNGEDGLKQNNSYDQNSVQEVSKISNECFSNPVASATMQSCVENKVYKCQECPRMFEKPSRLEMHRRSHSDEKMFSCQLCYQTFKYKGSLSRHIREQHYGQGRKSLSSTLDAKRRNGEESCFPVGESRFDRYLTDVTESSDGVFRHWKERHYSQERMSFSMVCGQDKPEDCSSLEKKNFEHAKCVDKSWEDEITWRLKQQDVSSRSLRKSVNKTKTNKLQNRLSLEENECQNNESEQDESSREISDEGNNISVMRDEGQDSSHDNRTNNSDVEGPQIQEKKKQLMKFNENQEDMRSMSSQNEENVDDTGECESYQSEENDFEENSSEFEENNLSMVFHHRETDTGTYKFDENDCEGSKQDKSDFSNRESNLEESSFEREKNNFEVTSKGHGAFTGNFTNAIESVNMQNHSVGKIYQCDVCGKVFVKRSTWSNHKRTHNDDMSYYCEICWKYFKYKGSLSRHIKEQHYGLGRKDQGNYNISNSLPVTDDLHKESKRLGPNMNKFESESPGNNPTSRSMIFDKTPKGDTRCSSILGSAVSTSKVDHKDSNFAAEKDAKLDDMEEKSSGVKHDEGNNDEALLTAVNLSVTKIEDLKENECLQNGKLEKEASDGRQSKSDLSNDQLQNSPEEITCEICGRYFKYKGSLNRHVKEQHYGLGRKSFKTNVDEIQRQVDCSKAMAIDEETDDCANGSGNCALIMPSFANESNQNCYSSVAKLSPQNGVTKRSKTVNDVLQNDDGEETFEPKRSYFQRKSGEHSEKDEVEGKHESFEERDFELKKAQKRIVLRPRNDLKKNKGNNFQVDLMESDQELTNMNTRQEDFDASDGNFKKLNTRKGNHSLAKKGRKCKKANFFACDECPKILPNRALLRKHKRVHSNEMSFACEICHQTFKYKGSLNRHVKEQHYGLGRKGIRNMFDERIETNSPCSSVANVYNPKSTDCKGTSFEEQNFEQETFALKEKRLATKQVGNYVNSTTSKTWKFSMQQCDKSEHNLLHGKGTNFEREQENFLSDDKHDLAKNKIEQKQNVDTKQSEFNSYRLQLDRTKMHKCPECPKLFWNISDLREHAYKHSNVKYFACELCAKAFKFRSGLVRHERKEHKKFDNIQSESRAGNIDENGFGEDAAFERNRSTFETEDCSIFCEQVGLNKGLKKKFSEGTRDYKTVVGETLLTEKNCFDLMNDEKAFGIEDSDFKKGIENSFKTDVGKRSEMEEECRKTALKDEHQSVDFETDVDAKEFTKRSFLEVVKVETIGNEEENFTNKKLSVQSLRQNFTVKKKSAVYNCNKCDAVFKQLCDFLTHQSIHK